MRLQTRTVVVETKEGSYTFVLSVHRAESPAEHLIEPEFYIGLGMPVPQGVHYEIEVVKLPDWIDDASLGPFRIYESLRSKRKFIYFRWGVSSLEYALDIIVKWCLGTVYTILTGEDFVYVMMMYGMPQFVRAMNVQNIVIVGDYEKTL